MSVRVMVLDVEADSQEEAMAKGLDHAWTRAHDLANGRYFEFAEECTGALVDEQGDEEYINSEHFDQKEVYDAESCDEQNQDQCRGGTEGVSGKDRVDL
jgi:hypothetical protein